MAWDYSDKTKELFMNAMSQKEGTHFGELEDADGVGQYGSIACGDAILFSFNVAKDERDPKKDVITTTRYKTFGCTSAIASSEALCIIIEDKKLTPIEALNISNQEIVDFLGGMPAQKIHCSVMGAEVLKEAVYDWAKKRGVELEKDDAHEDHDDGPIACKCFTLSEPFLQEKVKEMGLKSVEEVKNATKGGAGCGVCIDAPGGIKDILKAVWGEQVLNESGYDTTQVDIRAKVEEVFEKFLIPEVKKRGGELELVDVKGNKVYCEVDEKFVSDIEEQLKNLVDPRALVIDV